MSEVAGRMSSRSGPALLEKTQRRHEERCLPGVPGVPGAEVVVVGGGVVGTDAAQIALGTGGDARSSILTSNGFANWTTSASRTNPYLASK